MKMVKLQLILMHMMVDNDLDGLIDENYYLHYRQRKEDQDGNVLFDILNPKSYIDYISGFGVNNSMIDESRDDGIDNDGDWDSEYDDVGQDGIANTGDLGENNGFPDAGDLILTKQILMSLIKLD